MKPKTVRAVQQLWCRYFRTLDFRAQKRINHQKCSKPDAFNWKAGTRLIAFKVRFWKTETQKPALRRKSDRRQLSRAYFWVYHADDQST